jgi:hypothetical protein
VVLGLYPTLFRQFQYAVHELEIKPRLCPQVPGNLPYSFLYDLSHALKRSVSCSSESPQACCAALKKSGERRTLFVLRSWLTEVCEKPPCLPV